jgi:hypothetical protein
MDWSARISNTGARDIVYELQDYPMANIRVTGGDTLMLKPPPGGDATGLKFNFIGYSPCKTGGSDPATCEIDPTASAGPYLFTCLSNAGYSCPDPGVQQTPTVPGPDDTYFGFIKMDFQHMIRLKRPLVEQPPLTKSGPTHPAASAITAYVSCGTNNVTALQDPNGNSLTTITATSGESVFWISAKPFTMDTSKFPPNFCSNGNPPSGTSTQEAQCDVALSGQNVAYSVQAQTGSCAALPATLISKSERK